MKKYTIKNFRLTFILAIIFTIFFLIDVLVICIANTHELSEKVNISESIGLISMYGILCLPTILILNWHMCVERYMYLELETQTYTGSQMEQLKKNVRNMIILGIFALGHICMLIGYVTMNWKLLDGLFPCVLIETIVTVCWFVGWIYCIKTRRCVNVSKQDNKVNNIMVCVLVCITVISAFHSWGKADEVWYKRMADYFGENEELSTSVFSQIKNAIVWVIFSLFYK